MKTQSVFHRGVLFPALALALSIAGVSTAQTTPPDLTAPGAIAGIKAREDIPTYQNTYNLGSTGLRGWIFQDWTRNDKGQMTDASRQILVTTASTPGSAVVAVDDVILGAMAASSGTVPNFTSDARKAFGTAITNAEKTGAGTLRVKRWRAGNIATVNIPIATLGTYSATAPYNCPKSTAILASARNQMVGKLLADPDYLKNSEGHANAINALALLASVVPGNPNYAAVQTRLQTYARSLTMPTPGAWNWAPAYELIFLSEYYLLTSDTQVVSHINGLTVRFAKGQGMFGTYGHALGVPHPDGSGRLYVPPYGSVNAVGNIANIGIVYGKKALQAAGHPIDPAIDVAIQRSSGFMGSHVNKGCMQYGEHFPHAGSYATNSKDASAAVFFGLQNDKAVQTEYFARMSISSWIGVEVGHGGQGWGTLWGALGSGMGGDAAASAHFKQLLWRYDIHRRTDGSFTYDSDTGGNDYYGGTTYVRNADDTMTLGTYLGETDDSGVVPSSLYLLTYSLPLKRLFITGKQTNPAYTLDSTKVAHAVSAPMILLDRSGRSIAQLFALLGDYDPHVRYFATLELASRNLSSTDLTNLRNMLNDTTNSNLRGSAAEVLGYVQDATAIPALVARLRDSDHWVRQMAAKALRFQSDTTAVSAYRDTMLEAFIANSPADPNAIDWTDPLQYSNGQLGQLLFGSSDPDPLIFPTYTIAESTANAPKETLLYPALRIALRLNGSISRGSPANFVKNYLSGADAQALFPEVVDAVTYPSPGDSMFSSGPRESALQFLTTQKIKEGIPLALSMIFEENGDELVIVALDALASYGDAARYALPTLKRYRAEWSSVDGNGNLRPAYAKLIETIETLENAVTAPTTIPGLCVANSQVVTTTGAKAITLTGASPRGPFSFVNVTQPANGTLTGTAPNLIYTPNAGYTGPDRFTFRTKDLLTTSDPATVSIMVGSAAGTGIAGTYFNNADFTSQVLTRTDLQINFDWGTGSPDPSIGDDTFSVRWDGLLRVPETGTYTFSSLNSDGARVYVNGQMVIDDFVNQTTNWTDGTPVNLTAGQLVDLQMLHYENTGSAVAKLKWAGPSFAGLNGEVIGSQWLYDGSGTTRTPYAHAQTVTMLKDTSKPITLTGSGGTLTYAIVTTPTQGTLTGTAPNLTYTPPAGFSGSVSFTFRVNNGTTNSANATVTINVQAGNLSTFTWANAVSGNWNDGTKWVPSTPATAGLPYYALNFTNPGTYTATHNLTTGFQLNQLNTAANVTLAGTRSISFVANGGTLPQFNQNGPDPVTVRSPIALQAMTNVGGSGYGAVNLTGIVSGTGGIIKNCAGDLTLDTNTYDADGNLVTQGSANTFSGGTIINAGTLRMHINNSALGTGNVTLNGGILKLIQITAANSLTANAGRLDVDGGMGNTWNGTITLNGDLTVISPYYDSLTCNGVISGTGGLIVEAPSWTEEPHSDTTGVYLTAINTYTGKTIVRNFNTLICTRATALGRGPLEIQNRAKVNLDFTGNRNIVSLTLDGIVMPPGTYGSTSSPATNKNDTYFYGTGTVTVSNHAPVATPQSVSTAEDTQKSITLSGTDAENSTLTYQIVSHPTNGTLSGTAPNLTYRPAANYYGADSFTFRVRDATMNSAVATVSITVTPVNNDPPAFIANPIILASAFENIAYIGQTLAGLASDPDANATITYSKVSGPAWLSVSSDGTLSGAPGNDTAGLSSFVVRATDNTSAVAQVSLQINIFPYTPIGSGTILREVWTGVTGSSVSAIPLGNAPSFSNTLSSFEAPSNWADNYGTRIRGYISAPVTGSYTFWIASDDGSELWLSTDVQPANKVKIAELNHATAPRDWNSYDSQKSFAIHLTAGLRYYVEALHKEGAGGDHVAVGWAKPGESTASPSEVIPGGQLSPFDSTPPIILTLNPADNATGVAVAANLVATFSENISRGTTGNIILKNLTDGTNTTISVTDMVQVSISGATLTINPTANLLGGKNYAIQIPTTAIKDQFNNHFVGIANDTTWNFSTASPYQTWATTGVAFDADTNNDGVDNGMAWLLGATNPSENAHDKLPKAISNSSHLRLTFRCMKSAHRGGMVLKMQTSSDLGVADPWSSREVIIPDTDSTINGVIFDTTDDGNYVNVIADIPTSGSKLFVRLSAEPAP